MAAPTLGSSSKTILRAKGSINGLTAENMTESGKTIRWKDLAFLHGQTEDGTRASTSMIKKKETEFSTGPMDENTKEIGRTESNMELALTHRLLERQREASGVMEKE
jgi:hypothetical protein